MNIRIIGLLVLSFSFSCRYSQVSIELVEEQITELKLNYNFFEVEKIIKVIERQFPNDNQAQYLIADWEHFSMNYQSADSLYSSLLIDSPKNINALNSKAMIALDNGKINKSFQYLEKALAIDSTNIASLTNYSRALLENRDSEGFITAINKVLEIDSTNSDALAGKGFYFSALQYNIDEGAKYFNKAIESNPLNVKAHHYLGRGYSPSNYNDSTQITSKVLIATDSLLKNNQFESAHKLISKEYLKDNNDIHTLKLIAASEFHLGNYWKTIEYSFKILELKPNYGLAHYFIAESLNKLKNKHNILMHEFKLEYEKREVPKVIPFIEDVFINYHQCGNDLQKIIRINTEPFNGFMEALSIAGATVYFMDFHQLMFECPYLADIKGSRAVDFRLTDDIKGQGGYQMTSNKLQQTEVMYGFYNVAFHEFGHLIHWLFTYEQNAELKRLYIQAKQEGYTLDWYAASNELEYFAQGIEAYLSEQKIPGQPSAMSNTKQKLYEKDIYLYNFIESLLNQKSYHKNIIQAYILKSWYVGSSEDALLLLKNAFANYPKNPELLNEIGIVYRENGDYQNAEKNHKQVIGLYPNNMQAKLELSYDLFLQGSNIVKSISILEAEKTKPGFDSKMHRFLGFYYTNNGDYKKAINILKKAIELDPFPNPYDISLPDAFYLLAKAHIKTRNFRAAEENMQSSLLVNRANAEAYAELAFINYQLNNRKKADKYIAMAMQLNQANKRVIEINKLLKTK